MPDREIWYEIEYSHAGADDWFTSGDRYDSMNSARQQMESSSKFNAKVGAFNFRIVRKTLSSEVL